MATDLTALPAPLAAAVPIVLAATAQRIDLPSWTRTVTIHAGVAEARLSHTGVDGGLASTSYFPIATATAREFRIAGQGRAFAPHIYLAGVGSTAYLLISAH